MSRSEDDPDVDAEESAATDGGSPFGTTAEIEQSELARLEKRIDQSILTPMRILWSDSRGKLGFLILVTYLLMGTVGPNLIHAPTTDVSHQLIPPWEAPFQYPLGTNDAGQGLLALIVHATPAMLIMMLVGGLFAMWVGVSVGLSAGLKGGRYDQGLMALTDTMITIPGLPLVIVLTFIFDPSSPVILGLILSINNWPGMARTVRSQALPLRNVEYVESSKAMGISTASIIKDDILPNLMPYFIINFSGATTTIIFEAVGLYFLGIISSETANWGIILQRAFRQNSTMHNLNHMHWIVVPIIVISMWGIGVTLLSQAADRLYNPRIRARHAKTIAGGEQE